MIGVVKGAIFISALLYKRGSSSGSRTDFAPCEAAELALLPAKIDDFKNKIRTSAERNVGIAEPERGNGRSCPLKDFPRVSTLDCKRKILLSPFYRPWICVLIDGP